MHGTLNDNDPRFGTRQRVRAFVSAVEQFAHDLLDPSIWRISLTFVSFITTTYGLMLLYNTFAGGSHGSLWFLRFMVPIAFGGALHTAIFYFLTQWSTTGRRKYFWLCALPLQVLAILASFGTHWVGMSGASTTVSAYQQVLDSTERGIIGFDTSYTTMANALAAAAAHSNAEALVEENGGGNTCGDHAGNGQGSRYALRMSDHDSFSGFDKEISARKTQVDQFVQRAQALNAASADQAMAQLSKLRTLVNEAKARFESDPLLDQLRKAAEARILLGNGPIEIAATKRGRSVPKYFTCHDTELQRRLEAVIAAITAIKPLPDVSVPDYRDPDTGFPFALWRLAHIVGTLNFSLPSRESLAAHRIRTLEGHNSPQQQPDWRDITPLVIAAAIELALALLFCVGRNPFTPHPGTMELERAAMRQHAAVFDRLWLALGGSADPDAVRRTIDAHSKFEGNKSWIFVPLYGEDNDTRVLHAVMEMLVAANMARRIFTGRGLMARWYMRGWDPARRARVSKQAVRIYRMSAKEYLAFTIDALNRNSNETLVSDTSSTTISEGAQPGDPFEPDQRQTSATKEDSNIPSAA
jgi:hypothetical protein